MRHDIECDTECFVALCLGKMPWRNYPKHLFISRSLRTALQNEPPSFTNNFNNAKRKSPTLLRMGL
jgi:hypothetical protein